MPMLRAQIIGFWAKEVFDLVVEQPVRIPQLTMAKNRRPTVSKEPSA